MEGKSKKKEGNILSKKQLIIIVTICLLVIVICLITDFILFRYPEKCIANIENKYELDEFKEVVQYNSSLKRIKSYLGDEEERYKEIQYKVKISEALIAFENQRFEEALGTLRQIEKKDEIVNTKINECKYELGKSYLDKKEYNNAIDTLIEVKDKKDVEELLDEAYYNLTLELLNKKDYKQAMNEIENVKNIKYKNLDQTKKQINYEYAIYNFNQKDYDEAIPYFEKVGNYKKAKEYTNKAYIAKAEELIEENNLKEAKVIYDYISSKAEYNGIKASTRKAQLNKATSLINATGKKYATKTYCESRNVWRYDGRWTNWHIDKPDSSEYIDTTLELNDNGTFNLEGTVYFYIFDNFSSLQEYCQAKLTSRTIEMENVKSIPATYKIDSNTKLLYSNGKFSIQYSERDDYSTSFYNVYSSSVTY